MANGRTQKLIFKAKTVVEGLNDELYIRASAFEDQEHLIIGVKSHEHGGSAALISREDVGKMQAALFDYYLNKGGD